MHVQVSYRRRSDAVAIVRVGDTGASYPDRKGTRCAQGYGSRCAQGYGFKQWLSLRILPSERGQPEARWVRSVILRGHVVPDGDRPDGVFDVDALHDLAN